MDAALSSAAQGRPAVPVPVSGLQAHGAVLEPACGSVARDALVRGQRYSPRRGVDSLDQLEPHGGGSWRNESMQVGTGGPPPASRGWMARRDEASLTAGGFGPTLELAGARVPTAARRACSQTSFIAR